MENFLKKNILFYMPTSALTGGPRVLLNFLSLLDRNKFNPYVIVPEQGPLIDQIKQLDVSVDVFEIPFNSKNNSALRAGLVKKTAILFQMLQYNWTIHQFIKDKDIDLVWARNIKAISLLGLGTKWAGIPLIWDIGLEKHSIGLIRQLHNIGLYLSDKIITEAPQQSEQTFGKRRSAIHASKITTINPGISAQRIQELKIQKANTAASTLMSNTVFNILCVGTICERKNQLFAIQTLADLGRTDIALHLVGAIEDPQYMQLINNYITANNLQNSVFYYGWRNDIPAFMAAADVLLMTSTNEGIPYTVHEAMHIGLPAIVADAGGMAAAVIHGKTGFVFAINDGEHLKSILLECLSDKKLLSKMGNAGMKMALERFSSTHWYAQYEDVFNTLCLNSG